VASNGAVTVAAGVTKLDYESASQRKMPMRVRVTDSQGAIAEMLVDVSLTNVPEKPIVRDAILAVRENSPADTVLVPPLVATDVDEGQLETLTWSITAGNTGTPTFRIQGAGNVALVDGAPAFNTGAPQTWNLTVRVTDADGLFSDLEAYIRLTNINHPPSIPNHVITIPESTPSGTTIVADLQATDPDTEDSLA